MTNYPFVVNGCQCRRPTPAPDYRAWSAPHTNPAPASATTQTPDQPAPDNRVELEALQADSGRYLGYVRVIGRKQENIQSEEPLLSIPTEYKRRPLLLNQE